MPELKENIVVQKVKRRPYDFGYNARSDKYENMHAAGVIDPTKVTRVALENAQLLLPDIYSPQSVCLPT